MGLVVHRTGGVECNAAETTDVDALRAVVRVIHGMKAGMPALRYAIAAG